MILSEQPGWVRRAVESMRHSPKNVRFFTLCKVCEHFFGEARHGGGSHRVYKMPWEGDPRVNIQNDHGKAKIYQVKQVLKAIEKLETGFGQEKLNENER